MKKYVCKFLLFLLKKLGMERKLVIDYYQMVNGSWDFVTSMTYNHINNPPSTGQKVELFVNGETSTFEVVDVTYSSNTIKLYIKQNISAK
jgi:hypothetical protein